MFLSRTLRVAYNKATTGITGIPVHPNPREHLIKVYQATLKDLQRLPEHAVYRQATAALTAHRLSVVESTEDVYAIEKTLGAGQIEEVIMQAEDEALLVPEIEKWQAWEALEVPPPKGQWDGYNQ